MGETLTLRGKMWWEGKLQFKTHVAQPYPPLLGVAYAELMQEALRLRAVAAGEGSPTPMASADHAVVPSLTLTQVAWLEVPEPAMSSGLGASPEVVNTDPVTNGMGAQKGLTPLEHLEWSKGVEIQPCTNQLE